MTGDQLPTLPATPGTALGIRGGWGRSPKGGAPRSASARAILYEKRNFKTRQRGARAVTTGRRRADPLASASG